MPSPKQFKQMIESKNYSRKQVSEAIGMSCSGISAFLNGKSSYIKKSKYYRLCDLLNILVMFIKNRGGTTHE